MDLLIFVTYFSRQLSAVRIQFNLVSSKGIWLSVLVIQSKQFSNENCIAQRIIFHMNLINTATLGVDLFEQEPAGSEPGAAGWNWLLYHWAIAPLFVLGLIAGGGRRGAGAGTSTVWVISFICSWLKVCTFVISDFKALVWILLYFELLVSSKI